MKIAIVGSRDFPQLKMVEQFIKDLPRGIVLVSGGAAGVDQMARQMAEKYGLGFIEHLPDLQGCVEKYEYTQRYYARNQKIVDDADMVVAFTEKENGGTWDTIKRTRRAGKPVKIIRPYLLFPGIDEEQEEPEQDSTAVEEQEDGRRKKGAGPFHLKRITLGAFALNLKRYADPEQLADLVNAKESNPQLFCDLVLPEFIDFFSKHDPGAIHAITQAPKSMRNLHRPHPMDMVCQQLADALSCEYVQLFAPWNKPGRAIRSWDGEVEILPAVSEYIGKVVYVLDDFVTTGNTLKKSCRALTALDIHTHGMAYMLWS